MTPAVRFDLPVVEDDTRPWWDAAREGRLLVRRCGDCGLAHHYPRPFCPSCWSDRVGWEEASGRATLYTWSTIHRNDLPPFGAEVPYVAAVVELAEGPRLMTRVVDCDPDELAVGMDLEVTFEARPDSAGEHTPEVVVPVFRPARP
jgi:uncharacterized OB-fold protein